MKKINLKFQFNLKSVIFTIASFFFIYLLYLSIPSLYNTGSVQKVLSDNLEKDFNLNFSLSTDINYRILPQPHFLIKDTKIFNLDNNIAKEIAEIKYLKVYINQNNFFNKENLSLKKIDILKANFYLKKNDFKFINEIFEKKFSKKDIVLKKSKIFFNDSQDNTIFIYSMDRSKISFINDEGKNIFKSRGEIFKIPVQLEWTKSFENFEKIFKLNTKKINLDIINKAVFKDNKYLYENIFQIFSSKFKTNYFFDDKKIILNSEKSIIKNTPIKFNGNINLKPFSFDINLNTKEFNLSYFMKNDYYLVNQIILSKIFLNKNLNGNIKINSDKVLRSKIFDTIALNINLEQGEINLNDTFLLSKNIGSLTLNNSNLVEIDQKIFLQGKMNLDIKNIKSFHKSFSIPKKNRKELKSVIFDFILNFSNGDAEITKVSFINKKNIKVNSENIDDIVESNIDFKFNYKNPISFKNYLKKLIIAYSEEG